MHVLSPCCVAAAVAERVTYGCVDICMCKSIALKLSARCVPPRGAAQQQPRGCCAQQLRSNYHYQADNQADTSVRTIRLILRYYQADNQADTSVRTIRLILQYYQADNQANSLAANQADTPTISSKLIVFNNQADKDNQADIL